MTQSVARQLEAMIETQLVARGIDDGRVLDAFSRVPRHLFVDPADLDWAYGDHPLPIGCGQTVSQPYIVALSLAAVRAAGAGRVLEIGTGSGYQTALLALLAKEVCTVERIPALIERARRTLAALPFGTVFYRRGNGVAGWPERAPFDAIVVSAAARCVPAALIDQLSPGGRLVMPVGDPAIQALTLLTKDLRGAISTTALCECRFVPLVDAD